MTDAGKAFAPVSDLARLGPLDHPVSTQQGESVFIKPLGRHPQMLYKQYTPGSRVSQDDDQLDRLIALPDRIRPRDRDQLRGASCWPVSRVVEGNRTVGVLIPRAPSQFSASLQIA